MPWKDKTVEELRKEFIEAAGEPDANISALCREFEISRTTGYKWLQRAGNDLSDRSHAPFHVTGKTSVEIENQILLMRSEHPRWGAKKILTVLSRQGIEPLPCVKTGNNILKRNGCISPDDSQKHRATMRFEREKCNELWQTDFKGEFRMLDGNKCFPLDIIDDHARYCIGIYPKLSTIGIKDSFELAFREYGLPKAILSDNGVQFAGFKGGYTQFERWLMDLDICPIHGRVMHPQTQGKIERFHRSMKNELLKYSDFRNIEEATVALENWRVQYNDVRPHEALGMRCPADVYVKSERQYPDRIRSYEYSGLYPTIKVNSWGYLRFDQIQVYIGQTFENIRLEIRPAENRFAVCYRNFRIAEIDPITQQLLNRRISRLE